MEPQMESPGTEEHTAGDALTPLMENTECLNGPSSWLSQVTELLVHIPSLLHSHHHHVGGLK